MNQFLKITLVLNYIETINNSKNIEFGIEDLQMSKSTNLEYFYFVQHFFFPTA